MKYIFAATGKYDGADNEMLKGLLEEAGIPCMIRNENLSMAMGEIPPTECAPELWVMNDEDYPRAKGMIESWQNAGTATHDPWVCPKCSERIEGQFTSCWKCGAERAAS